MSVSFAQPGGLPPTDGALQLMALGRNQAAGAVLWLVTGQKVGSRRYSEARYPALENWLAAVFRHNPYMKDAYVLGAVILLTDRERSLQMDRILADAERRYPDDFEYPMLRGMGAYFGALDATTAADHFERASTKPHAPEYLGQFGAHLRRETATCGTMIANMKSFASASSQPTLVRGQIEGVYLKCLERELNQAAAAFRLNEGRAPSLDDLLDSAYLRALPPSPPGQCWVIVNANASLVPCPPP